MALPFTTKTVEYFAARHGAVKDELNFVLFVVYRFAVLGGYARSIELNG